MMSSHHRIYVVCGFILIVSAISAWGWVALAESEARADAARWEQARAEAARVLARIQRLPVSKAGAPQPDHVAILARRILVAGGVGQEALAGIQPLGDAILPGGAWHRQQVLLQLRGLSTGQAAAVVTAVSSTDPSWIVSSIQLTHVGTGDTYDASLALTTLYPAQP